MIKSLCIILVLAGYFPARGWAQDPKKLDKAGRKAQAERIEHEKIEAERILRIQIRHSFATEHMFRIDEPLQNVGAFARPDVAKMYGISTQDAESLKKLDAVAQYGIKRVRGKRFGAIDFPPEVRQHQLEKIQADGDAIANHAGEMTKMAFLDDSQTWYLRQDVWKRRQVYALDQADTQNFLKLSKGQRQQVAAGLDQLRAAQGAIVPSLPLQPGLGPLEPSLEQLTVDTITSEIWDLLTPEQKEKWQNSLLEPTSPALRERKTIKPRDDAERERLLTFETEAEKLLGLPPSPLFVTLKDPATATRLSLDLSQQRLIAELDQVTRAGLGRILKHLSQDVGRTVKIRDANRLKNVEIRAKFTRHAEELARKSILDEKQAKILVELAPKATF